MKLYNINVNGRTYEVEVEEAGKGGSKKSAASPVAQNAAAVAVPTAPAQKSEPAKTPAKAQAAGAQAIEAPMPGTVFDIKVKEGQQVKAGDILVILEAMKMENEIMAPCDGTVAGIHADKGAAVTTGDLLVTLK